MNLKNLAKRLPGPAYALLKSVYYRMPSNRYQSSPVISPGPISTQVFARIHHIPGWFNLDDCAHFTLILSTQAASGITGDILEIGSYHGRSTCVLAMYLNQGEKLVVCDVFDMPLEDRYGNPPTKEILRNNIRTAEPNIASEALEIHQCQSRDLRLETDAGFRFIHIDGGHDMETVLQDLELCALHLRPGGVLALDDYSHPHHPGVTQAAEVFLQNYSNFEVLADLNRQGAIGRKLYVFKRLKP